MEFGLTLGHAGADAKIERWLQSRARAGETVLSLKSIEFWADDQDFRVELQAGVRAPGQHYGFSARIVLTPALCSTQYDLSAKIP